MGRRDSRHDDRFPPYVPVHQRQANAARYVRQQAKAGRVLQPVLPINGGAVAQTFWGRAWCESLEAQADLANRLARGLSYVRHGAVVDLRLVGGAIDAVVLGSEPYKVCIRIAPLAKARWKTLVAKCHAEVGTLVDLLQGDFSPGVMRLLTAGGEGILPQVTEVTRRCSCPDFAALCKHMAAVLYAIGARLDSEPMLLFALRQVDARQLTAEASEATSRLATADSAHLSSQDLGALFDIDLAPAAAAAATQEAAGPSKKPTPRPKPVHSAAPRSPPHAPAYGGGLVKKLKAASRRRLKK